MIWQPPLLRGNLGKSLSHQRSTGVLQGFQFVKSILTPPQKTGKKNKSPTPQNKQNKRNRYLNREIDMQILSQNICLLASHRNWLQLRLVKCKTHMHAHNDTNKKQISQKYTPNPSMCLVSHQGTCCQSDSYVRLGE